MSECCCRRCGECDCKTNENGRRDDLLWTLESRYSMRILMWLEVSGPDTLRGIMDGVTDDRKNERTIFIRIQGLAELGLVELVPEDRGLSGGKKRRRLTPEGHRVAEKLLAFFEEVEP